MISVDKEKVLAEIEAAIDRMSAQSLVPYYEDDSVTIYNTDALHLLRSLPPAAADALVTDPPYSSGGMHRSDRMQSTADKYTITGTSIKRPEFDGDNRDQRSYHYWSTLWLSEALRVVKSGGLAMVFTDWRQLPITSDAIQAGGWVWRGVVPWNKTEAARPDKGRFRNQCEYVVWGSSGPLSVPQGAKCHPGLFTHVVKQSDKHHITGKPTPLMVNLLRIIPSGTVLDPFMGSGTTLRAAKELGLKAIGCDTQEINCEIAAKRMAQLTLNI